MKHFLYLLFKERVYCTFSSFVQFGNRFILAALLNPHRRADIDKNCGEII